MTSQMDKRAARKKLFEDEVEKAYCARIAEGLLEYELDPKNFTREMRARNSLTRRGLSQALPVDKPSHVL